MEVCREAAGAVPSDEEIDEWYKSYWQQARRGPAGNLDLGIFKTLRAFSRWALARRGPAVDLNAFVDQVIKRINQIRPGLSWEVAMEMFIQTMQDEGKRFPPSGLSAVPATVPAPVGPCRAPGREPRGCPLPGACACPGLPAVDLGDEKENFRKWFSLADDFDVTTWAGEWQACHPCHECLEQRIEARGHPALVADPFEVAYQEILDMSDGFGGGDPALLKSIARAMWDWKAAKEQAG